MDQNFVAIYQDTFSTAGQYIVDSSLCGENGQKKKGPQGPEGISDQKLLIDS